MVKVKVKFTLEQPMKDQTGNRSTISLTSALDVGGWLRPRTGPRWAPGPLWKSAENLDPIWIRSR